MPCVPPVEAKACAAAVDGWAELLSWDNLLASWRAAAAGKKGSAAVAGWEYRLGDHLLRLQRALADGSWRPGRYQRFEVHEPKRRVISAAPFADRIVHHALMRVTAHRFERSFSPFSYANRVGMGTLAAIQDVHQLCGQNRWALRLDVKRHFQSIDHALMLQALFKRIAEPGLRTLVQHILSSAANLPDDEVTPLYLPGDDLWAACRPSGLPIGNLTSQCWSNVYMDPVDQFVTRELGCKAYARYVDDMMLLHDDKHRLQAWGQAVRQFAAQRLRLRLHANTAQVQPTAAGVPWLGMVLYPTHRLLKSRKVISATRSLTSAWQAWQRGDTEFGAFDAKVQAWVAHAKHADSWHIRATVLERFDIAQRKGMSGQN